MAWFNSSWAYRKPITIDSANVDSDLTDFPVLIKLDADSDLSANAQSSGDDIVFTTGDETTQLSHEIESYDSSTGTLWAHVKVPSLSSSSDTTIYCYYGNSSASNQETVADVWSNGYESVYHLNQNEQGTGNIGVYTDSTSNNRHGDDNVSATGEAGQIAQGQTFDPSNNDTIPLNHQFGLSNKAEYSVTGWLRDRSPTDSTFFLSLENDFNSPWQMDVGYNTPGELEHYNGNSYYQIGSITADTWTKFGLVHDPSYSTEIWTYIDGAKAIEIPDSHNDGDNTGKSAIGDHQQGGGIPWDGSLDEFRIATVARSSAWLSTSYTNQNDPLSFYSVSTQKTRSLDGSPGEYGAVTYGEEVYGGYSEIIVTESPSIANTASLATTSTAHSGESSVASTGSTQSVSFDTAISRELSPTITTAIDVRFVEDEFSIASSSPMSVATVLPVLLDSSPVIESTQKTGETTVTATDDARSTEFPQIIGMSSLSVGSSTFGSERSTLTNVTSSNSIELSDGTQSEVLSLIVGGQSEMNATDSSSSSETTTQAIYPQPRATDHGWARDSPIIARGMSVHTYGVGNTMDSPVIVDTVGSTTYDTSIATEAISNSTTEIGSLLNAGDLATSGEIVGVTPTGEIYTDDTVPVQTAASVLSAISHTLSDGESSTESIRTTGVLQSDVYNQIYISESPTIANGHLSQSPTITSGYETSTATLPELLETRESTDGFEQSRVGVTTYPVSREIGTAVTNASVTGISIQSLSSLGEIEETGAIPLSSTVWTNENSLATDPLTVIAGGLVTVTPSSFLNETARTLSITSVPHIIEFGVGSDGGSQTQTATSTATETAAAQHVVGMTANVLQYSTETADGHGSARFSAPFDPHIGELGFAIDNSQFLFTGDHSLEYEAIAADGGLLATNGKYSVLYKDSATSIETPDMSGILQAQSPTHTIADASAIDTATFESNIRPVGAAKEDSEYHTPLEPDITPIGMDITDLGVSNEDGASVKTIGMQSPAFATARDLGTFTTGMVSFVLEGGAGVQTEIITHYIRTTGQMSATGSTSTGVEASSTATSTAAVDDSGIALQSLTEIGGAVNVDTTDRGVAGESLQTGQSSTVETVDVSSVVEIPDSIHTSKLVVIDEFGSGYELPSTTTPGRFTVTGYASATDQSIFGVTGLIGGSKIEDVPIIDDMEVFQSNTVSLADEFASVRSRPSIETKISHQAPGWAESGDSGRIIVTSLISSSSTIPGLRRTISILGQEKDFVYDRSVGASRDVEVDGTTDGEIEVGPVNDLVLTTTDRSTEIGPIRSIEISQSDT